MKRRLNILCVIVMLVLSYSVLEAGYYLIAGAKLGAQAVVESEDVAKQKELMHVKYISLLPHGISMAGDGGAVLQDSVYNEKSGTYIPAIYSGMVVCVDTHPTSWEIFVDKILLLFLQIGLYIWAIVLFIRLIISINKSDIFNWKNVRRLRRIGLALIVDFGCSFLSIYFSNRSINEVFSLRGYDLVISDAVSTTMLVLGICSLIVGEVFAIGLKMKEEQDLTI